jgi:hypothetical protein
MNWKTFLGSKKIFILSLLPSIIFQTIEYFDYLNRKDKLYDGCGWVKSGDSCSNYLDYIGNSFGGWELTFIVNLIFIILAALFTGSIYFVVRKKKKTSTALISLLIVAIALFFTKFL